jgi:hypothetical protein
VDYVSITAAISTPETGVYQREITGKMHNKNCDKACTGLEVI